MDGLIFKSQTYGNIALHDVPSKIKEYWENMRHYGTPIGVTVGTDSQNFSDTKVVNVVAVVCEGHGGIFFYHVSRQPRITNIRQKLHEETNQSLGIAMRLTEIMESECPHVLEAVSFSIHVDAGRNEKGGTSELVPELVGWIRSCGYDCEIKPASYAASTIADKISK